MTCYLLQRWVHSPLRAHHHTTTIDAFNIGKRKRRRRRDYILIGQIENEFPSSPIESSRQKWKLKKQKTKKENLDIGVCCFECTHMNR
jgi:hypothetical protein